MNDQTFSGIAERPDLSSEMATLRRILTAMTDVTTDRKASPVVTGLLERINALSDELAFELGLGDPEAAGHEPATLRVDHVGVAVRDLGAAARLFTDHLGGAIVAGGSEPASQLKSVHVAFPGGGKVELLEPLGDNPIARFIEARGEGVHHLTLVVTGLAEMVARLQEDGYRVVDIDLETPGWHEAYVSPKSASGCLVQLVETSPAFGRPTGGITIEDIVADRWEWHHHHPRRRQGSAS